MTTSPARPGGASVDVTPDRDLRWVPIVHGAVTIVFGGLLLFTPGRGLTFVATLAGISLCLVGLIDLVRAFSPGLTASERAGALGIAAIAAVAGIVVIARPEGSIKTIAVIAGIYLLVMGVTSLLLGPTSEGRGPSRLRGALALVAGVALLVWPDVTVGAMAAVYGAFLLALGAAEVFFGLRMGRADDTA
jgi:uncharacterized membrane protein HdeD (DUF308 family)